MANIICIDDRKSKVLELNRKYIATKDNDCYVININENNIKVPNSNFRRKSFKVKKKYFIEI